MAIHIGSNQVTKVYKGTTEVDKVYKGSDELYSSLEPETVSLLARMDVQPTEALKQLINTTIKGLKDDGVWDLCECLYMRGVHTAQAACLNWISNNYNSTLYNSPNFTAKRGFKGDGISSYINNNFQVSTGTKFTYTNNSLGLLMDESPTIASCRVVSAITAPAYLQLRWYSSISQRFYDCCDTASYYNGAVIPNAGVYCDYTLDGTNIKGYLAGSYLSQRGPAVLGPITSTIKELAYEGTSSFCDGRIKYSSYGSCLTAQQIADKYNRIKYFYDNVDSTF